LPNEREDYFVDTIKCVWNLGEFMQKKTIRSTKLVEAEKVLFEKIRQRTVGTDNEGKT
jgi:hypothetical protein